MPLDVTDTRDNQVSILSHAQAPRLIRRDTNTIVLNLNTEEILTLIHDLVAEAAFTGSTHLVIEADAITFPKDRD